MNQGFTTGRGGRLAGVGRLAVVASLALLASGGEAVAQTAAPAGPAAGRSEGIRNGDLAAGAMIDSIFESAAEGGRASNAAEKALGGKPKASVRPQWTARLARNPKPNDGNPPFVLIDRYGGIQRYVEATPTVNLEKFIGQTVAVRRDTGHTLLASQLELPKTPRPAGAVVGAGTADRAVRLAAAEQPLQAGEPTLADGEAIPVPQALDESGPDPIPDPQTMQMSEGQVFDEAGNPITLHEGADPLYLDEGAAHLPGCETCGSAVCQAQGGCGYGSRPILYVRGEYLAWWADGMYVPPLVVRGDAVDPGTPGDPTDDVFDNAFVVFGNQDVLDGIRSGGRVRVGYWLDDYGQTALEAEYLGFGQVSTGFVDGGDGTFPIVGRPFIDATTGLNAVEDVSFPGIAGTVSVNIDSQFQSAGIGLRRNLCCVSGQTCCGDPVTCGSQVGGCDGCGAGVSDAPCLGIFRKGTRHTDLYLGFRWAQLDEGLAIQENLTVIPPSTDVGTTFQVNDAFATSNNFVGGELGFLWDWEHRRWSLELLSKLAIGSTRQQVVINGSTIRTEPGELPETGSGGLLAQDSNIGQYERNELSVLPQLGATLGFKLTERLKLTGGYTFLYWSRVARPGDQIDLEVNPNNLPFATIPDPDGLPARPQFTFRDTDFWAHGVSAGLEYQW